MAQQQRRIERPSLPDLSAIGRLEYGTPVTYRSLASMPEMGFAVRAPAVPNKSAPTAPMVPELDELNKLARTTLQFKPLEISTIWPRLNSLFKNNSIETVELGIYSLRCRTFVRHSRVEFTVSVYRTPGASGDLLIEFLRQNGCGCAFSALYREVSRVLRSSAGSSACDNVSDAPGELLSRVERAVSPPPLPLPLQMEPLPLPPPPAVTELSDALGFLAAMLNDEHLEAKQEGSAAAADLAAEGVNLLSCDAIANSLMAMLSSSDPQLQAAATSAVASIAAAATVSTNLDAVCEQRLRHCLRQLLANCQGASCCYARREAARALTYLSRLFLEDVRQWGGVEALKGAATCGQQDALLGRFAAEALRNIAAC